jgi:alkylhydroperoxidase family enzyme
VDPKFSDKLQDLERRLLDLPATLDPSVRQAAAGDGDVPEPLSTFVDKIRLHAYRVTDEDVEALQEAGYSEDQIFELTVATAYGAASRGLHAGLEALARSSGATKAETEAEAGAAER